MADTTTGTIDGAPDIIVRSPSFDERALPSFIIPQRMGYRWKHFNHRISKWKFGLARNGSGHPWADHLAAHSVGGPYSTGLVSGEHPSVKFGFQRVELDSPRTVGAARRQLTVTLGPSGVFHGRHTFDRRALNLRNYKSIVPLITGFGFDTDVRQPNVYTSAYDPAHGYQTRGLGAGLDVVEMDEHSVTVAFSLRYGFGSSMDRPHHNEALLDARVGAELDIALVGVNDVPVHCGEVGYEMDYEEPQLAIEQAIAPAPDHQKRVVIDGAKGAPEGIVGLQSFNFDLTPSRSCSWNDDWPGGDELRGGNGGHPRYGQPGYYIRELTLAIDREAYDSSSGKASFLFDGYASNATHSIAFHPMHSRFEGRMVWLQTDGALGPHTFARDFETGRSEFSLLDFG